MISKSVAKNQQIVFQEDKKTQGMRLIRVLNIV